MSQIMSLCGMPRRKTRIMYQTNLSYLQMETYLSFLNAQGLIELNNEEFQATPKGQRFLEAYTNLKMLLDDKPRPLIMTLLGKERRVDYSDQ